VGKKHRQKKFPFFLVEKPKLTRFTCEITAVSAKAFCGKNFRRAKDCGSGLSGQGFQGVKLKQYRLAVWQRREFPSAQGKPPTRGGRFSRTQSTMHTRLGKTDFSGQGGGGTGCGPGGAGPAPRGDQQPVSCGLDLAIVAQGRTGARKMDNFWGSGMGGWQSGRGKVAPPGLMVVKRPSEAERSTARRTHALYHGANFSVRAPRILFSVENDENLCSPPSRSKLGRAPAKTPGGPRGPFWAMETVGGRPAKKDSWKGAACWIRRREKTLCHPLTKPGQRRGPRPGKRVHRGGEPLAFNLGGLLPLRYQAKIINDSKKTARGNGKVFYSRLLTGTRKKPFRLERARERQLCWWWSGRLSGQRKPAFLG